MIRAALRKVLRLLRARRGRGVIGYPPGQSYASHAFRPSPAPAPRCCWYCGLGASDPFHAAFRERAS